MVYPQENTTQAGLARAASNVDTFLSRNHPTSFDAYSENEASPEPEPEPENARVGNAAYKVVVICPRKSQRPVSLEAQVECVSPVEEHFSPPCVTAFYGAKFSPSEEQYFSHERPSYEAADFHPAKSAPRQEAAPAVSASRSRRSDHRDVARATRMALLATEPGAFLGGSSRAKSTKSRSHRAGAGHVTMDEFSKVYGLE
jgi:hypothetical protein